ncbi:guanyl-nucleotide exchange factor, variant [Blastomyces dermatitidis ER-3]|uniref:Guanyl-nucleotide exchange factor n=1 Tax=Ajellomyces dermatitidis (strain ER-3 / ATCC MYA-2586) TaxID=559297 RepID=A0ABX2VPW5_AJEDR|nr:guanyl-nucleotide exchange factor [Blastomyces dermatitidis ER-3]XP_045279031.1 guanyl-nucleotide exchange factor, variant [Blastomyces dermatitidis ER-3]OAS99302.1 guanyl-nucleotide exchange factor [Blastomyces dermatitidis ER-3]OAS99303.1 guanyl-nucleotide exchange factor, variant [Blastomyces dermatitidis ER-3]
MGKFSYIMTWKGFRLGGTDDHDSQLQQSLSPGSVPVRHSEQIPRSPLTMGQLIPRFSESTANSPLVGESKVVEPSSPPPDEPPAASRSTSDHNAKQQMTLRNRFSLMRFRHASDPQLSVSYNEAGTPPPVPSLPPPPTIITTSPTLPIQKPAPKRKSRFKPSSEKPVSERAATMPGNYNHTPNNSNASNGSSVRQFAGVDNWPTAPSSLRASHISFEEPGRLSTTSIRSGGPVRAHGDGGLLPGARLSESSRSDGSSAEYGVYSKNGASASTSSLFRLPRLKRSKGPLFPLPVKLPPQGQASQSSEFNRPQTGGGKKPHSSTDHNGEHAPSLPSLPSPSQSSLGFGTPGTSSPGTVLFRKDSIASAHSARSSTFPNAPGRISRRRRSSTMGSLPDIQDDPHHSSPNLAPSSRTPTNTGGRRSFGDFFAIPSRFKHSHDQNGTGNASPSFGAPATPASIASKSNSFSLGRDSASCPVREDNDTPAAYLSRLEGAVRRSTIASILSQSAEEFYATALRKYMRGFSFFGDPIDMAIRKLLMEVELPKETQQIDRVVQSFADRYHECNPGIYSSTEQAYFIAFSLLILHTDVFNKNNKRKMQKPDYVRNTQGEGIAVEILECFYENIIYTPFIHVEDELNLSRLMAPKTRKPLLKVASADNLPSFSRDPIDPYALILDGKLGSLRPNLKDVMELEDPYSSFAAGQTPDMDALHHTFHKSSVLQIVSARSRPDAFLTTSSIANPSESHPGLVDIRVAKVGLLWRKDPKKKKTRSPWQEWGAVLTGSQLYFFRDIQWVKSLIAQCESLDKYGRRRAVIFKPPITDFKPDAVMSTHDAVALLDSSYKKHKHAFLLVRHGGFEEVFLANSEAEMHDWIVTLNYAATFRTTGVRMRGMIGANYEGQRDRRSTRADSTTSEMSNVPPPGPTAINRKIDPGLIEEVSVARRELMSQRIKEASDKLSVAQKELDDLLRNARHLQVLTPIHPRARDQVILAAGRISAKIKWARLEISRTRCHREMLSLDLSVEERLCLEKHNLDPLYSLSQPPSTQQAQQKLDSVSSHGPRSPTSDSSFGPARPVTPVSLDGGVDRQAQTVSPRQRRPSVQKSVATSETSPMQKKHTVSSSKEDSLLPSFADPSGNSSLRQPSVNTSVYSNKADDSSCAITSSGRSTPVPSVVDDEEERFLREAGILTNNASPLTPKSVDLLNDGDMDKLPEESTSIEHRGKVRRSLHRSLREAHHIPHHHRSKKGREPASSIAGTDDGSSIAESESLSRGTGSFTLHGKKASVVNFGSEWQNMSHEQRLKLRKPMQHEDSRGSDTLNVGDGAESLISDSSFSRRPNSLRSISTATARSLKNQTTSPGVPAETPEGAISFNEAHESTFTGTHPNAIDPVVEEESDTTRPSPDQQSPATQIPPADQDQDGKDTKEISISPDNHLSAAGLESSSPLKQNGSSSHSDVSQEKLNYIAQEQVVSA